MKFFLRRLRISGIVAGIILGLTTHAAHSGEFPEKSIQMVSPFAAGGTNDYLTRLMAQHMGTVLKTTVVVDNRTGANGLVGAAYVAKSAPDGYTLLMGNSATHGTNPTLYPNQPYNSVNDFYPVSIVGAVPIVLVVNSRLGVNNIDDLIAYGKANPGKLAFGSSGLGGTGHLAGEAFKAAANIDMIHIPYKGDAPAVADTMGGQVPMAFVGIASARAQAESGKVKIIALANNKRVVSLPNVPTMAEAGFKNLEFSQWYALFTPAGTSSKTIEKLNQAVKITLQREDVRKSLASQGAESTYSTPEEVSSFVKGEIQRFGDIIRRLNIKVN